MKKGLLLVCSIWGALLVPNAQAQPPGRNIDQQLLSCKNKAVSTLDSQDCYSMAATAWDHELNAQYQALMQGQSDAFKTQLRTSQRAWIKYKDSYYEAMNAFYQQQQGTIWTLVAAEQKLNVIRDKALDLWRLRQSTDLAG